jgi:hypothetical protein
MFCVAWTGSCCGSLSSHHGLIERSRTGSGSGDGVDAGRVGSGIWEWSQWPSSIGARLELPGALAPRDRGRRVFGTDRLSPVWASGNRGAHRCSAGMGGTSGGRLGGDSTLLALPLDDVEPPRLLDMGKSVPPDAQVSQQ